ncbi:MAG: hypothetical protein WC876_07535 [Candidatus Thermoplasmatota archaeon]|jgi:hypothetical protein
MRALLASALLLATLAGCSEAPADSSLATDSPASDDSDSQAAMSMPMGGAQAAAAPPEPIELTGSISQTVAGCTPPGDLANLVPALMASAVDVPSAAWNRIYTGPGTGDATVNVGEMCVVWVVDGGDDVYGGTKVPENAVKAVVVGDGQAQGSWSITIV